MKVDTFKIDAGPLAINNLDPHAKLLIGHTIADLRKKIHFRLNSFQFGASANDRCNDPCTKANEPIIHSICCTIIMLNKKIRSLEMIKIDRVTIIAESKQ